MAAPADIAQEWLQQLQSVPPDFAPLQLPAAGARVEVRILPELERQHLEEGIQLGLYATSAFASGEEVTPYGGILTHSCDYHRNLHWTKTHARQVRETSFLLDGIAQAMMYRRPVPKTAAVFAELLHSGIAPLLPACSDFHPELLAHFNAGAVGFMANTARCAACNVRVGERRVKAAGISYPVPVLIARRAIVPGEEIFCRYGSNEGKRLLEASQSGKKRKAAEATTNDGSRARDALLCSKPPAERNCAGVLFTQSDSSAMADSDSHHDEDTQPLLTKAELRQLHPANSAAASASAAAAASSSTVDAVHPDTLVIGVAFVNEIEAQSKPAADTSIAGTRDRARLIELEKMGHEVISMNDGISEEKCLPNAHLHGSFSKRVVPDLLTKLHGKIPLKFIFGDYFRFRTVYLVQAYSSFLREMLPQLVMDGVVGLETQVIIPWLPLSENAHYMEDVVKECFAKALSFEIYAPKEFPSGKHKRYILYKPIKAAEYPLYRAAEKVGKYLGNYENSTQLQYLDSSYPFLLLCLTQSSHESKQSFDALFPLLPNGKRNYSAVTSSRAAGGSQRSSAAAKSPAGTIDTTGWQLFEPHTLEEIELNPDTFVSEWLRWAAKLDHQKWELMPDERGGYFQTDASEALVSMCEHSRAAGQFLLRLAVGKNDLVLNEEKLLEFPKGKGLQEPHCDAQTLKIGKQCYTVLFYLTAGESTALPDAVYDRKMSEICFKKSPEEQKTVKMSTYPVQPCSSLVLSQKVLHHAPMNKTDENRLVLFQQWVPRALTDKDSDAQRLPFGIDTPDV
jgi:hypothetical protein